jgi:hypothetical protein
MTTLTSREARDLADLVRKRERVAKSAAKQRSAELLAKVEAQLSTIFKVEDERWRDIVDAAKKAADDANAQIAMICAEGGIPEDFQPRIQVGWLGRRETAYAERRAELRKLAQAKIAALEAAARVAIERQSVEAETQLLAGALSSDGARQMLATLPSIENLMPTIGVDDLGAALPRRLGYGDDW